MKYVMGMGNYSMFDDSIGIKVVEYISENGLDEDFTAIDLSGNCIGIISYFNDDTEAVLIIDTARFGDMKPGEYKIFSPDDVRSTKDMAGISSHEGDVMKVLELAKQTGYPIPRIKIMGIEPESIKDDFGLSDTLSNNLKKYVDVALAEIKAL